MSLKEKMVKIKDTVNCRCITRGTHESMRRLLDWKNMR